MSTEDLAMYRPLIK